ncbi:MAG: hypothetical protein HOP24_03915 [Sideroxydans sp.]|nr:hypothetical protein [Sideroxydans sp.]
MLFTHSKNNTMPMPLHPRSIAILITVLTTILMVKSCNKGSEESSSAYQAACQGSPLHSIESRNKALEDGYLINHRFNCIDKESFVAVAKYLAKEKAANTPEAVAQRAQEKAERDAAWDRKLTEERAQRAVESQGVDSSSPNIVLHYINVNTATESELANVIGVGSDTAAQIIEERNKQRFNDWADLVHRVVSLSSAQTAVYASICGLNVDGKSLDGAPPDAEMAAAIYQKQRK